MKRDDKKLLRRRDHFLCGGKVVAGGGYGMRVGLMVELAEILQNYAVRLEDKMRPLAFAVATTAAWDPLPTYPVCGDLVVGGSEEYLGHIKTKHPEEWRRLETDPSYSLVRVVPVVAAGMLRCQYCGAPYAYRENLEVHERGCPKRGE